jgi:hypothetical protein
MVNYYVRADGNNANAGTGPTAGAAWQTIAKALGTTGIASGDTVYLAPGVWREQVTVAMVSATAETFVKGDPRAELFTDLTPAPVRWTSYTTSDTAAPGTTRPIALAGRDFLTFEDIHFVGGAAAASPSCVDGTTVTSTNVTFRRCTFLGIGSTGSRVMVSLTNGASIPFVWLFDNCVFGPGNSHYVEINAANSTDASDYDVDVTFQNCIFLLAATLYGVRWVSVAGGGGGAGKPGGGKIHNCLMEGGNGVAIVTSAGNGWGTATPAVVRNSIVFGIGGTAFLVVSAGQIVEDFNWVYGGQTNVTVGTNSKAAASHSLLLDRGHSWLSGFRGRPWGTPLPGAPALGFGSDAAVSLATDFLGRPRPAGGASTSKALGPLERHDTGRKGITLGAESGSGYLEQVGPADDEFEIPVDAAATTITVKCKWDSAAADTNKPQASILKGGEVGWPDETVTATGTAGGAYETLTFVTRTPSKAGIITLRLISRSAAGNGIVAWDSVLVAT